MEDSTFQYFDFAEPSSSLTIPETYRLDLKEENDICESSNFLVIKEEDLTELDPRESHEIILEPSTNYVCLLCKVNFASFRFVYDHVDRKHSIKYKCKVQECCKSLTSIAKYKTHMTETHTSHNLDDLILKILQAAEVVAESSLLINCLLCSDKAIIGQIQEHVEKIHPFLCRVCGINFKNGIKLKSHKKQHSYNHIKFFNCSECRAEFKSLDLVKPHYDLVHLDSPTMRYSRGVKKFSKAFLPVDCPFCEAQVLSTDFQTHVSNHKVSFCRECSCANVDLNSVGKLCVVCSDNVKPEPKRQKITENSKPNSLKVVTTLPTCESLCGVCGTPKRGPQCAVCKPRTTRVCLSLSEFSECERRCTECRATLWSYKYIQICLNCLPRDVASLDINLSIVPQPLPKPGLEKPREEAKLLNHTVTSTSSIADDDHIESYDILTFEPQSPEANFESEDFDEASSEAPWIDTAPDADWTMAPVPESPPSTPCDYCEELFSCWLDLRSHMTKTHPEFKKRICAWCSNQSPSRESFLRHRVIHRSDIGLLCHFCGQKFKDESILKRHTLVNHLSVAQKHTCTVCNKSYNNKVHLTTHLKTHRERKFQCEHCSKKFKYKYDIESHMQTHTGVFMHRCKMCKARFTRKDNLNQHVKYNHNFACPICGLTLPTAAEVRRHRGEAHTREQLEASQAQGEGEFVRFTPFQCEVCSRFLASKQSLDKHLTTHTRTDKKTSKSKPVASEEAVMEYETCETVDNAENRKRKSDQILPSVTGGRRSVIPNKRYYQDYV